MAFFNLFNAAKQDRSNGSISYKAIRYCATGVFGYLFEKDNNEVFKISSLVLPNPDIHLSGFDKELIHKHFDREITLLPGVRRKVVDRFEQIDGYYEFVSEKEFHIVVNNLKASVVVSENGWLVFDEKKKLAEVRIIPNSERQKFTSSGYDMEESYLITIADSVDRSFCPYIMAIPMLSF